MELTLLKETPQYVVCVKPSGVESEHQLLSLLQTQTGWDDWYPVHRLDKETGGVMVVAKTKEAAAILSRQVQQGEMGKRYLAVVSGCPDPLEGTLEDLLYHDRTKNKSYVVRRRRNGVKSARLSYRVVSALEEGLSLVEVQLHTGRTHQIRVQFSSRKMPLLGDRKYGGKQSTCFGLWAKELSFADPVGGQRLTFTTLPDWEVLKGIL